MRIKTLQPPLCRLKVFTSRCALVLAVLGTLWLPNGRLWAQATVTTLGGSTFKAPWAGFANGNTFQYALFSGPAGMALDASGTVLLLADYTNNALRMITAVGDTANSVTYTLATATNSGTTPLSCPVAVVVDGATNIYVLNRGSSGSNGSILHFGGAAMSSGGVTIYSPLTTGLVSPTAMTMDGFNNLYVTVSGNKVIRVTSAGTVTTVGTISQTGASLQGITMLDNGQLALTDAGNNGIWLMNPITGAASKFTGFNGAGDVMGAASAAKFNGLTAVSKAGGGILVVADRGNNKVKLVDNSGNVSLFYGVSSNLWLTGSGYYPGWLDGPAGVLQGDAESRLPTGLLVAPDGSVYTTEDYYSILRHVTGTGLSGPQISYPQTLNGPAGLAYDSTDNFLFIANSTNNAVELLNLNLSTNATSVFLNSSNGITNPAAVLMDSDDNLYVLDRGIAGNGSILEFDIYGNAWGPVATNLNQPTAFTIDDYDNIFVTEQTGNIRAFGPTAPTNVVATITNARVSLQGIALFDDGTIAVSDAGNHVIWTVNPITKLINRLTGQLGTNGAAVGASNFAKLNQPHQLCRVSGNQLVGADYGNSRLVLISRAGKVTTNSFNYVTGATLWFGNANDPVASGNSRFVTINSPFGVAADATGDIFDSEVASAVIRRTVGSGVTAPASTPGVPLPVYSGPAGISLNNEGTVLFVADPTNDTISALDLANNQTTVVLDSANGIYQPVDVGLDSSDDVYVLNQGTGGNGSIMEFDPYGNLLSTVAASLSMPTAMKLTFSGDILVTELNGLVQIFNSSGSNTLANITTNSNVRLQGIARLDNGLDVVSDAGNDVLWSINPGATNASVALFTGIMDTPGTNFGAVGFAKLNRPMRLAQAYGGLLVIADSGNNRVVVANDQGTISSALHSTNAEIWFGLPIDPVKYGTPDFVPMITPAGVAIGQGTNATVFASEDFYRDIRGILNSGLQAPIPPPPAPLNLVAIPTYGEVTLTWSAASGATNYLVGRSPSSGGPFTTIGSSSSTSFTDTNSQLVGGTTWYYVVSAVNAGGVSAYSAVASATLPYPAITDPLIGYVTYPPDLSPPFGDLAIFTQVSGSVTLNNDADIVIIGAAGSQTFYTYSNTVNVASVPDPTASSASAKLGYQDYMTAAQVAPYKIGQIVPALSVKAIGMESNYPNSAIVSAQFLFVAGNPTILGDNAANFAISDITDGTILYYTLDESDPSSTNPSSFYLPQLTGTNITWTVQLAITTNTMFKVRAFKPNYQSSAIVTNLFMYSAYRPTSVSFGTGAGELHSTFQARPGQFYYAPVTLNLAPGLKNMYSLQFNVAVTNGMTNLLTGKQVKPIVDGAGIDFFSMLMTQVQPFEGTYFPPMDGNWYLTLPALVPYASAGVTNLVSSMFVNTNINLLGIGWLYRTGVKYSAVDANGVTYLDFDTTAQNLINYSIAHDTLFKSSGGTVIAGAFSFQIPTNAVNGDQYFIQLGSPSATMDGIGELGSSIPISAPLVNQAVTITSPSYLVGDAAPFRWLNAGDFGDTNLDDSDVMQVYQSALLVNADGLGVDMPPLNSDLFAAMDSSGGFGSFDGVNNYYTNSGPVTFAQEQAMWDGNDQTINSNAFGDGVLDINDVYVTFRRSLDPSLVWFERYWTNGMFVAVTAPNLAFNSNSPNAILSKSVLAPKVVAQSSNYRNSAIVFASGDAQAGAGSTIKVPITANILGSYPLRVLGLSITVYPLDGSPAISNYISFADSALYSPDIAGAARFPGNFNAAWLTAADAKGVATPGLSNYVTLGTLSVTLPATASQNSAYGVHFDFASGSPNGLAVFPKTVYPGLITTTPRTNSYFSDGIPDSWRLRWFGTIYNALSQSNACPSGDGVPNWKKFIAGVDPNTPGDFPSVNPKTPLPTGSNTAITWPSVLNKQYVIMRATSLYGSPWTILSTNTGTGGTMEYNDSNGSKSRFYRVEILP